MRDAPQREYKLELNVFLRGVGAPLRSAAALRAGVTDAAMLAELNALPRLEFYMPVSAHRKSWDGDKDVIVATQLEDTDAPIAWDVNGRRVSLDLSTPPQTPVIVIVPVETDFTRALPPSILAARGDAQRQTIEDPAMPPGFSSYALECDTPECGGGGGGSGSFPAGLYITFQRLVDQGEPWTLGAPEIEVHIHGPQSSSALQYGADLACSGDRVGFPRGFNQDAAFWSGESLLFDQSQINAYNAIQANGFNVSVWEDDNTVCQIKKEDFNLAARFAAVASAAGGYAAVSAATGVGPTLLAAATFLGTAYSSLTFLWSNDDFLGTYVNASAVGVSYSDANHVLYINGGQVNGRAMLVTQAAH
ncbi:MAG: hypothetical protein IT361_02885 [Gemmatimonadaceae bacterium]|nr:hypothetical protein [Gemmatimonadaceae bacterium]